MSLSPVHFGNITESNVTSLTLVAKLPQSFRNDCRVGFFFLLARDNSYLEQSALPSKQNCTNRLIATIVHYKNTASD